jgi:hypothetical protein
MLALHTTLIASMTAAVYWPMPVETPALVCDVHGNSLIDTAYCPSL